MNTWNVWSLNVDSDEYDSAQSADLSVKSISRPRPRTTTKHMHMSVQDTTISKQRDMYKTTRPHDDMTRTN